MGTAYLTVTVVSGAVRAGALMAGSKTTWCPRAPTRSGFLFARHSGVRSRSATSERLPALADRGMPDPPQGAVAHGPPGHGDPTRRLVARVASNRPASARDDGDVEEIEVVVAHNERATLRVGDVFLKIDADQTRTDIEVEAMAMAPIPTPEVLWRKPPVLGLAALKGTALGHLGEASTASAAAWAAAGAAARMLHEAPPPAVASRVLGRSRQQPTSLLAVHASVPQNPCQGAPLQLPVEGDDHAHRTLGVAEKHMTAPLPGRHPAELAQSRYQLMARDNRKASAQAGNASERRTTPMSRLRPSSRRPSTYNRSASSALTTASSRVSPSVCKPGSSGA